MKSILDPSFRYTSSAETDVRKTFARIWNELRAREKQQETPSFAVDPVRTRGSVPGISRVTLVGSRLTGRSRDSN